LDSTCNRMSRLAKTELFEDQLFTPEEIVTKIDAVTSEDILRLANQIFRDDQQILTAIGPFKAESKYSRRPYREY
jgi:predicted Zn-dependent peptidase